jgi:hypothetical protein
LLFFEVDMKRVTIADQAAKRNRHPGKNSVGPLDWQSQKNHSIRQS